MTLSVRSSPFVTVGDCSHPLEVVHVESGLGLGRFVKCKQRNVSKCEGCGKKHRRNVARVARSGFVDQPLDRAFMFTLTAPGVDVLPWNRARCTHGLDVECSGPAGCRVDPVAGNDWDSVMGKRWNKFITYLRRDLPGVKVDFFKCCEWQDRGVLHLHVLVRLTGVATERRVRAAVRKEAAACGFGPRSKVDSIDVSDPRNVARTAGYCAKYVSKTIASDERWLDGAGKLRRARPWSSSRSWGDTMVAIGERQRLWAASAAGASPAGGVPAVPPPGGAVGTALDLNGEHSTDRSVPVSVGDSIEGVSTM